MSEPQPSPEAQKYALGYLNCYPDGDSKGLAELFDEAMDAARIKIYKETARIVYEILAKTLREWKP